MAVELVNNTIGEAKYAVGDSKKAVGDVKYAGRVLKETGRGDERSGRGGGSKMRKMMTVWKIWPIMSKMKGNRFFFLFLI